MPRPQIAIIGAGDIGGTIAHLIALKELGDIILFDIVPGLAQGKALDISESFPIERLDCFIKGTNKYEDIQNSDVVIVTAGLRRTPGMTPFDLLDGSSKIIREIAPNIKKHCPQAFIIVVSNPLDAMVWLFQKESGLPHHRVVGMAGVLDCARYSYFLAKELKVSVKSVAGASLGGHREIAVPLPHRSSVAGISLPDLVKMGWTTYERLDAIVKHTREAGGEIANLLQTKTAYYAPASATVAMVKAYLKDEKRIFPCAVWLNGEYGIKDFYFGVPVVLGAGGVEKIVEIDLSPEERAMFDESLAKVREMVKAIKP